MEKQVQTLSLQQQSQLIPPPDLIAHHKQKKILESDFFEYVKWSFKCKKKTNFIVNWHHIKIAEMLTKVHTGEIQNLIINMPPRYGKTEEAVKAFIEWCLAISDQCKFIHLTYSESLALDNSSEIREDIKSDWYQEFWPLKIKRDTDSKSKWETLAGGGVYATGTTGSITGFGAGQIDSKEFRGAIIIDDPLKPEEAHSESQRKKANDRLNNTILSRKNDSKTPVIIIMQRLHEDDMTGFCLAGGTDQKFTLLSLPALDENDQPLWPLKHNREQLKALEKADRGTFAGQYMQAPRPDEGNLFKRQWWKWYRKSELPKMFHAQAQSWDFAVKEKQSADYTVGIVGARFGANKYLLDIVRDKMNFPKQCNALINTSLKWRNAHKKLIEDKANGSPILDSLKLQVTGMVAIQPIGDKVFRANAILPEVEGGYWYLPHPDECPWIEDFIEELATFPNAKHDDQVDAFVMLAAEFQKAIVSSMPIAGHGSGVIHR